MKFHTLFLRHDDAVKLGSADKALMLEFIRWSCHFKESQEQDAYNTAKFFVDGVWWMQDSIEAWNERMPWLGEKTIRRYLEELCEKGFIAKRMAGSRSGGRVPNFYRPLDVIGQFDPKGLSDNLTEVIGQFDQGLSDNLTSTSLSKNRSKNQTKKSPLLFSTWPEGDPLGEIFENLTKVPACRRSFHREKYREWLHNLMKVQAVDVKKLNELSKEWSDHFTAPGARTVSSPLAAFGNWVKRHFAWGKDNGSSYRSAPRERMGESGYNVSDEFFANIGKAAPPEN